MGGFPCRSTLESQSEGRGCIGENLGEDGRCRSPGAGDARRGSQRGGRQLRQKGIEEEGLH